MTSWQDEHPGSPFSGAGGDPAGRPMSRRAAREAERRAETMTEKPPHPSGVVDFEAHDFSAEFTPDQDFTVGDTQDIWRALTRGAQPGDGLRPRQGATPSAPQPVAPQDSSAMPSDLMDRVRDAVLRRQAEPEQPPVQPAAAQPAFEPRPQDSQSFDSQSFDPRAFEQGPSRRERRRREAEDQREDGLPTELFDVRGSVPTPARASAPQPPAAPQPSAAPQPAAPFDEYAEYERAERERSASRHDQYDVGYYDEPYSPEPTVTIPVRGSQQPRTGGQSVGLPQAWSEPAGDDRLTFSSPLQQVPAETYDAYAEAEAEPEFIQPADRWDEEEDEDEEQQPYAAQPRPASAPVPFVQPQRGASFGDAQVGPPSELTDLAGFEALIRKARQQPPAPQPVAAPAERSAPATAWADDDEDEVQDGFGSLLSRQVQSSHGTSPALILPNDPQPVDMTQAVSGSGDIFVTGTMKLSNRFSTTGASEDHYDSHDIDRLYDVSKDEPAAGVAPVRASKAVSGATASRVVTGKPGRGNLLPTVLAIVAGAMAVGVVTLLVGSWVFKIF